jgi:hypothetical protein
MARGGVRGRVVGAVMVVLLMLAAADAVAQPPVSRPNFHTTSSTGIGYAAVLPAALGGAGVWHIFGTSRIGAFADVKMTVPRITDHHNYCPQALGRCDIGWVESNRNDFATNDDTDFLVLNAGGMYAFTEEFALMLGGGMVRRLGYRTFVDDAEEGRITHEGTYYVPHEPSPSWGVQATGAMLIRASRRVAFSFGYETGPSAMNAGIFFVLN